MKKYNWKEIKLDEFKNIFYHDKINIFENHKFEAALKFHSPGLAPVKINGQWFHINTKGEAIYENRYQKTFGFYHNRAAVISEKGWIHINTKGKFISNTFYKWCGNFQENLCVVQDKNGSYFHIDLDGNRCYKSSYSYVGDFKYGFACIMNSEQQFTHIDKNGAFLHQQWFLDLGIYHKGFATAKDKNGWFHIDFQGNPIYENRFSKVEPFYNGWAFVTNKLGNKQLISESGEIKKLVK